MLDHFVTAMYRSAPDSLRRSFSFKELTRTAPKLNLRRIKLDWQVADREDSSDEFILTCARERLYGMGAAWISMSRDHAIVRWLDDSTERPEDKFVAAMVTLYRKMLELPETLPRWQVHIAAAQTLRHHAGNEHRSNGRNGGADRRVAAELARQRNEFNENVTAQWSKPLAVVLAEMERRPKPGMTTPMIVSLLHTLLNGLVLWRAIDADTVGDDEERIVGVATLALLEGLTEPDEVTSTRAIASTAPVEPSPDALRAWVRHRAPEVVIDLYRRRAADEPGTAVVLGREDVVTGLSPAGGAVDRDDVDAAVKDEFPDVTSLHDAALRRRLANRVNAALEMRDERPGSVLRQITSNLVQTATTDGALLRACARDDNQPSATYLADLERIFSELLARMGSSDPADAASTLLGRAVEGDGKTIKTLLAMVDGSARRPPAGRQPFDQQNRQALSTDAGTSARADW